VTDQTETARELLWRHNLPEDVIDGALCLHAQELAAVQRLHATQVEWHSGDDQFSASAITGMRAVADIIDPTHPEGTAAVPAGQAPATDRAALRDRIAEALYRHEWPHKQVWQQALATDREYFLTRADAVLAVLPASVDGATVYAEVADRLAADAEQGAKEGFTRIYRRSAAKQVREWGEELRRAAEAGPADTVGQDDGEETGGGLRYSEDVCPGFPDRCPNIRAVEPDPPIHYGGIRCGCAHKQPAAAQQPKEARP
jgi:hypothetical protein